MLSVEYNAENPDDSCLEGTSEGILAVIMEE